MSIKLSDGTTKNVRLVIGLHVNVLALTCVPRVEVDRGEVRILAKEVPVSVSATALPLELRVKLTMLQGYGWLDPAIQSVRLKTSFQGDI